MEILIITGVIALAGLSLLALRVRAARRSLRTKQFPVHRAIDLDGVGGHPLLRQENFGQHELPGEHRGDRRGGIAERLVHEHGGVCSSHRGEAAHGDVRLQVETVRDLPVDPVAVRIPRSIEIRVVGVGRNILDRREVHADQPQRDRLVVPRQDGPTDPPEIP